MKFCYVRNLTTTGLAGKRTVFGAPTFATRYVSTRGTVVKWLERLIMVQKVAVKPEFEAGLEHWRLENCLLSTQQ